MLRSLFSLWLTLALTLTPALAVQNETATDVFKRVCEKHIFPCRGKTFKDQVPLPLTLYPDYCIRISQMVSLPRRILLRIT